MNKTKIFQQPVSRISRFRQIPACLFASYCLLVVSSCTLHEVEEGRDVIGDGEKIEMAFSLSVSPESAPRTRSFAFAATGCMEMDSLVAAGNSNVTRTDGGLTEVEETTLTDLCVVQYNEKGTQTGKPAYYPELTYTTNEAGDTLTLDLTLDRNDGTNTVYLLANVGDQAATLAGKTEAEFKALAVATSSVLTADGMPLNNTCVLVGSWTGKLAETGKKVSLTRALAKISFSYEVVAGAEKFSFTPTALKVCSVPAKISYTEPKSQLPEISYTTYVATSFAATPATNPYCWYLPENLAGKAPDEAAVYSEKEKIGTGVSNATYIELTGNVEQGGVSYPGVVFKLYPGSLGNAEAAESYNDYNVTRNSHHAIHVKLMGIDFSDKRFTVGKLTPMERPDTLACGIGEVASLQITARPGTTWSFLLPVWLSACIDNKTNVPPLYNVSYFGSASLQFTTTTVNPEVIPRNFTFRVDTAVITLTQDTAAFWVYPQELILNKKGEAQSVIVTATDGLPWTVSKKEGSDSIKTNITSYIGTQTIAFDAIANEGEKRTTVFTLGTMGSVPRRELAVAVTQKSVKDVPVVRIDKSRLDAYKNEVSKLADCPPFNNDGGLVEIGNMGTDDIRKNLIEGGGSYMIEVQFKQDLNWQVQYPARIIQCANLVEDGKSDWRLPTAIELFSMAKEKAAIEAIEGVEALQNSTWSCSVGKVWDQRVALNINGVIESKAISYGLFVRCVRDY